MIFLFHENLFQWRDRVHTNGYNFIIMCRYYYHVSSNYVIGRQLSTISLSFSFSELKCVPDVFSLIEWSNLLTAKNSLLRFDITLYLFCLERKPDVCPDLGEILKLQVHIYNCYTCTQWSLIPHYLTVS